MPGPPYPYQNVTGTSDARPSRSPSLSLLFWFFDNLTRSLDLIRPRELLGKTYHHVGN
jgi:hypothetical protein